MSKLSDFEASHDEVNFLQIILKIKMLLFQIDYCDTTYLDTFDAYLYKPSDETWRLKLACFYKQEEVYTKYLNKYRDTEDICDQKPEKIKCEFANLFMWVKFISLFLKLYFTVKPF